MKVGKSDIDPRRNVLGKMKLVRFGKISLLGVKRFIGKDIDKLQRYRHFSSFPEQTGSEDTGRTTVSVGVDDDATIFYSQELLAYVSCRENVGWSQCSVACS